MCFPETATMISSLKSLRCAFRCWVLLSDNELIVVEQVRKLQQLTATSYAMEQKLMIRFYFSIIHAAEARTLEACSLCFCVCDDRDLPFVCLCVRISQRTRNTVRMLNELGYQAASLEAISCVALCCVVLLWGFHSVHFVVA